MILFEVMMADMANGHESRILQIGSFSLRDRTANSSLIPPSHDLTSTPPPRRSKHRPTTNPYHANTPNLVQKLDPWVSPRSSVRRKTLWTPEQELPPKRIASGPGNAASIHPQRLRQTAQNRSLRSWLQDKPSSTPQSSRTVTSSAISEGGAIESPASQQKEEMLRQPETRPISQEQLVAEVKGIYAGLVMVEAKCIEVDKKQVEATQSDPGAQPKLSNEQWQALIALHRTLLHEHHDFFLASQHPSASPALRQLASKYAMPARMWRHGIHSFLELLRHRLPASLEHMLAFIYLAYSMMALLYETVPAFEDTWIECLGDLSRYRMAIEDDDIRDREVWTSVTRHWYSRSSDKSPTTGRLYHHLAILARPDNLQQFFYYSKSLCLQKPFITAQDSILTLFEPILNAGNDREQDIFLALDRTPVKAHNLPFAGDTREDFEASVGEFLDRHIGRVTRKFMEQGYYIAVANALALRDFASDENILLRAITCTEVGDAVHPEGAYMDDLLLSAENAQFLTNATIGVLLQRIGDRNVLPFIHVTLVFMHSLSHQNNAMDSLEDQFPWKLLASMLNNLVFASPTRIENSKFPIPEKDDIRPFPEDYAMRGLLWTEQYFPDTWFENSNVGWEDRCTELESLSMNSQRSERVLWLGYQLSKRGSQIFWDSKDRLFCLQKYPDIWNSVIVGSATHPNIPKKVTQAPRDSRKAKGFMDQLRCFIPWLPFDKYLRLTWMSH